MNIKNLFSLSAVAVISVFGIANEIPAFANIKNSDILITQAEQKPDVQLKLTLAKKTVRQDQQSRQIISWQVISNQAVRPGDILRYTVTGQNIGNASAKNLLVTQPIPQGTAYVIDSANSTNGAEITYSIDNGKTFVAKPMVEVTLEDGTKEMQPAPDTLYTHVRWRYSNAIPAQSTIKANYQVRVR